MLALPTLGFSRPTGTPPVLKHNIRLEILCDWIEGSVLFGGKELLMTDVIDALVANGIYDNPGAASEIVVKAWDALKLRHGWLGDSSPFSFFNETIKSVSAWQESPAHSFCVLLSMPQCYKQWTTQLYHRDYGKQGRLFEALTKASIETQFPGWAVHQTGWSPTNTVKLSEVVDEIVNRLGEKKGNIEPWENPAGNEAGLDLLCYRPFPDRRVGIPVYLMQCASGKNWYDKLHEPVLNVWTKMILFAAHPRKAFAIPFALRDKDFKNACNRVGGMLVDRYRLLAAAHYHQEWVPDLLKDELIAWITPRFQTLPRYT